MNIDKLPAYYQAYLNELKTICDLQDVNEALAITYQQTMDIFATIYPDQIKYSYANGKWTLGQVLGHLIDVERIFTCRAMRIARGDKQKQQGFNENEYTNNSSYHLRDYQSLKNELLVVQESTGYLFENMQHQDLQRIGNANNIEVSVEEIGFVTAAHRFHHLHIIKTRYINLTPYSTTNL